MKRRSIHQAILLSLVFVLPMATVRAPAQNLEDSLDAELDEVGSTSIPLDASPVSEEGDLAIELGDELESLARATPTPSPSPTPAPKAAQASPPAEPNPAPVEPAPAAEPATALAEPATAPVVEDPGLDSAEPEATAAAPIEEPPALETDAVAEPQQVAPAESAPAYAAPEQVVSAPLDDGADQPNLSLERRLFRIFDRANPVPDDRWGELIGANMNDVYAVQAGDTLWDISQTLFGDGLFWSKLWSQNGTIENPHQISPGKEIRLVAGTVADAPEISVAQAGTEQRLGVASEIVSPQPTYLEDIPAQTRSALQQDGAIDESALAPAPQIPEPTKYHGPLEELPSSFVSSPQGKSEHSYDQTGLDVIKRKVSAVLPEVIPSSYLADATPTDIGRVEEIEASENFAGTDQVVFLRLDRPAKPGETLSTRHLQGKVKRGVASSVGPVVEIGGLVRIVEEVSARKRIYRAIVTKAVNPIRVGSIVSEEKLPSVKLNLQGRRNPIEARVLGGEHDEKRRIFGDSAVIYLDRGSRHGITDGDLLAIQARRAVRRSDSEIPDWQKPIGILKVIKTMDTVSTAIVIRADEEIAPGDVTGPNFPKVPGERVAQPETINETGVGEPL